MANVLSMDLRVRFKQLMDQGLCAAAAGRMLLVSPAIAARWGKKVRDGASLEPRPSGPRKGSGRLEPFMPFFLELIEQDPDITLAELQAALLAAHDVTASTSGIDALLRRHGYSYKKRPDRRRTPQARGAKGAT
jgi:transposase